MTVGEIVKMKNISAVQAQSSLGDIEAACAMARGIPEETSRT